MMDRYRQLLDALEGLEDDFAKFYEQGNGAAGTRVRRGLVTLRTLALSIRREVQEMKAARSADGGLLHEDSATT